MVSAAPTLPHFIAAGNILAAPADRLTFPFLHGADI
jgi:hypothetical protein